MELVDKHGFNLIYRHIICQKTISLILMLKKKGYQKLVVLFIVVELMGL